MSTALKRAELARLLKLRNSGVAATSVDGVQTSFRSMADLNAAIASLERDLGTRRKRQRILNVYMGHR